MSSKSCRIAKCDVNKAIAGATLAATVGLISGAFFQDIFKPVILNEIWWILIGLTAAAYRIEWRGSQESHA